MTVIVIDNASLSLRGELTKWMIEVKPGVFVGKVSSLVRDVLWNKIENDNPIGALLIWSCNTEQGYSIKMHGDPVRSVIDIDGLQLIRTIVK